MGKSIPDLDTGASTGGEAGVSVRQPDLFSEDGDYDHDGLAADLTRTRWESGDIAAQEVSLGPFGSGGAADVVSIRPSWSKPRPTIYEVKVSRSDFLSDIRSDKWERYVPYSKRLYFATPKDLVDKGEVPKGAGLMYRNENGWYSVKASRLHHRDDERERQNVVAMALLLSLKPSPWEVPHPDRKERLRLLSEGRRSSKAYGEKLARKLSRLEELEEQADRTEEAKETLRVALESDHLLARIDKLAEKAAEELREGPYGAYNRVLERVHEVMPIDEAFDPMSLAGHVSRRMEELKELRRRVDESEDAA